LEYSEWSGYFFSDNIVSNEAGYLKCLGEVGELKGAAYIGLGPEQNFSYISSTEPELSVIIDIRRDNYRLHLLYKAIFEEAQTPIEWLSLLLGRRIAGNGKDFAKLRMEELIAQAEASQPSKEFFMGSHNRLVQRIASFGAIRHPLDRRQLRKIHQRFFDEQFEITFQLRKPSKRTYPSLRQLLCARGSRPGDECFLGKAELYQRVRRSQIENRIIPIVGDFTGHTALAGIGAELGRRGLEVGLVYASNVEQYIFDEGRYGRWVKNLGELPMGPEARIIRSYVDQGRAHPRQEGAERITTIVQSLPVFLKKAERYRSYWEIVTDESLAVS
jgi:hypothetical protein